MRARLLIGVMLLATLVQVMAAAQAPAPIRLNIGFSARVMGKTNRTDLTAACTRARE